MVRPAIATSFAMKKLLSFAFSAHFTLIAMENLVDFSGLVFIELTFQTGVFTKCYFALGVNAL